MAGVIAKAIIIEIQISAFFHSNLTKLQHRAVEHRIISRL
ncbi:TPA: hypothetical protein MEZ67_004878 [Klebsiella pneumoniae]|nr:hypothetical protein [Klebsiella pneumoniae]HBW3597478.1 hypothetical protein [Klebsiella pneumoniae]